MHQQHQAGSPVTETPPPFEVVPPLGPRRPLVAHVPHSSSFIPDEVRSEILLSDAELAQEMLRLHDAYTDDLYAGLGGLGVTSFVNRRSRFVFDPERFLDESSEPMAPRGMGVVYWRGTRMQPLREVSTELRARRVRELYQPYHAALDAVVADLLAEFGACTVIDCHSFPDQPAPIDIDQRPHRPDVCIGTDPFHTPADLADAMEAGFIAAGYRTRRDSPFAGTFVPSGYHGREPRVRSVMIEVNRRLYMDEATGGRLPGFDHVAATITDVVARALPSM